jgi:hypothetical protein
VIHDSVCCAMFCTLQEASIWSFPFLRWFDQTTRNIALHPLTFTLLYLRQSDPIPKSMVRKKFLVKESVQFLEQGYSLVLRESVGHYIPQNI